MPKRVAITGLGVVSPYGVGIDALWAGLASERSTLGPCSRLDLSGFPCHLAAEIKDFSAKDHVPKSYRKAVKVMARDTEIAVAAAKAAVEHANIFTRSHAETNPTPTYPPERVGCQIGAGLIAAETLELTQALATAVDPAAAADDPSRGFRLKDWGTIDAAGGMNNLQPLWLLKYLPNMLACHVTIIHGTEGASNTITCGEASGLLSLGESRRVIERGECDACFSGSAESKLSHMGVMRAVLAGRVASTGTTTDGADVVRPFDGSSGGTLVGEGGGIIILEEWDAAEKRNATKYAEVIGFGASHSVPARIPPVSREIASETNAGLARAILAALADAKIGPTDIDLIVTQGTGSAPLDAAELGAMEHVFGGRLTGIPLFSLAPFMGDLAAGQGGVQVAVAAMALHHQTLPAQIQRGHPRPIANIRARSSTPHPLRHVLVHSGSLTGQNAAMVLRAAKI
ncbi:MAG: beta-ketoacyl synthase N-terminal-like domain-containing protein [Phycisphaerales bacterium]|jgi:3-oxoacyl-[acyl-carrier-protein] synthase II